MTTISSHETQSGVRYRVRYRKPDGSQTDKRGFKRKRDAEQWAAEHVTTAKARGSFIDPQDAKITVGEIAEAWLAKKRLSVKPSYIVDLEGAWRKWVEPSHAGRPAFHFQSNTESLESGRFAVVAVRSSAFRANKLRSKLRSRFGVNEQNRTV